MPMPSCCACGSIMAWHSDMTSANDTDSVDSDTFPDSITERSRISLINFSRCHPPGESGQCFPSESPWQRGGQLHQLGETEDRIERATKLMAHAGEEIRFREVGFLRGGLGARQLDVRFLERLLVAFALRHVPRDGQYALQRPIPVVEGSGVVGYLRFLPSGRAR